MRGDTSVPHALLLDNAVSRTLGSSGPVSGLWLSCAPTIPAPRVRPALRAWGTEQRQTLRALHLVSLGSLSGVPFPGAPNNP